MRRVSDCLLMKFTINLSNEFLARIKGAFYGSGADGECDGLGVQADCY